MTDVDFSVHDILVSTAPAVVGGQVLSKKTVSFMVGNHGPFNLEYTPAATGTGEQIKADIQKQIDELRVIHSAGF